jgi:hypothetical protein
MTRVTNTLLGLTLALALGACAIKSNASNKSSDSAKSGEYSLAPVEHTSEEAKYAWNTPNSTRLIHSTNLEAVS